MKVDAHGRSGERIWMTYAEAETYTGLERTSLWRAVKRGELRAGGVGRAVRFHRDELDLWLSGEVPSVNRLEGVRHV